MYFSRPPFLMFSWKRIVKVKKRRMKKEQKRKTKKKEEKPR